MAPDDPLAAFSWETIGWIGVDAGACAFGDAAALGPTFALTDTDDAAFTDNAVDYTLRGIPLIAYRTGEDNDMPVEVARASDGAIVAARLCATNEVDALDGVWRTVGELDITSGRCLAADPYCAAADYYRFEFHIPADRYLAELFDYTDDDGQSDSLALRIRRR